MILLPCPVRPDLDCIAGSFSYAEYLQKAKHLEAKLWVCGTPDGEAQFYIDLFRGEIAFANPDDISRARSYILVDFSDVKYIPDTIKPQDVIEVIDHRDFTTPKQDFPNARVQIDPVGAAATQIAEYFMRDSVRPSLAAACMLYGAIYSNTLGLKGQLCTERDLAAAAWLKTIEPKADHYIADQLAARKKETLAQFPDILATEMKIGENRFGTFGISQLEMADGFKFWHSNRKAILDYFDQYSHPVYLGIIDLSINQSLLYFNAAEFASQIQDHPALARMETDVAYFDPAQMRKQIIPYILNM